MADPGVGPQSSEMIPIAELRPSIDSTKSIKAVVALIWPYSASNKSLTLLLAEPDFRLRRNKGQVKAEFHGSSAMEVGKSGLGSGDEVFLRLEGVDWTRDDADTTTPGKGIEWKISFGERVLMQIYRDSHQLALLNVDHPTPSPEPDARSITPARSPASSAAPFSSTFRFVANSTSNVWSSPAFLKRTRISSGSVFEPSYHPFAEGDAYTTESNTKRTKLGRFSGQWRYAEKSPSPENGTAAGAIGSQIREVAEYPGVLDTVAGEDVGVGDIHSNPVEAAVESSPAEVLTTTVDETREVPRDAYMRDADRERETPFTLTKESTLDEIDTKKNSKHNTFTNDMSSVNSPATISRSPMPETDYGEVYPSDQASAGDGRSLMVPLALTPLRTVATETAVPVLAKKLWEVSALPVSPRLRPLSSPGLPPLSPIMDRKSQASSAFAEHQNLRPNFELDTGDNKTDSQILTESMIEDRNQDGHASGESPDHDKSLAFDDDYFASPSRYVHVQVQERMTQASPTFSPEESDSSQQTGRDQNHAFGEYRNAVRAAREVSVSYSKSSRQKTSSDPASSVHKRSGNEVGSQGDWDAEDFGGFTADDVSSGDFSDGRPGKDFEETSQKEFSDESYSYNDEKDERDLGPFAHDQEDDERDTKKEKEDTIRAHAIEVIDLEEDSEDVSQHEEASPSAHLLDEVSLDLAAVKSPLQDGPHSTIVDLESSASVVQDKSAIPEHISYPTLPLEIIEQPGSSHSPLAFDSEDAWETRLDPRLRTQLITPNATQQTLAESEVSIETLHQDHDLPTPQLTQSTSAGLLPPEATSSLEERVSIVHKLQDMRTSVVRKSNSRISDVSDAISPWFAPKRLSQVQEESEDDDEGSGESEQSLALGAQNPSNQGKTQPSRSPLHLPPPRSPDSSPAQNGHAITHELHPAPPPLGLRTPLSYFAPLSTVSDHFASTIDVLAIAISTSPVQRAKSGPKDFHRTLYMTDPSSQSSVTRVQIFRPFKGALPVAEKGAAILLRNFQVQSKKHNLFLVSTASSAWAVFGKGQSVQVNGPPVEIGAEERGFAKGLCEWWASLSDAEAIDQAESERARLKERAHDDDINGNGITKRTLKGTNGLHDAAF